MRMKIEGVYLDNDNKSPVVLLKEEGANRRVPIWIGTFEAMSILIALEKTEIPRPITHDLALNLMESLGGKLSRIEIGGVEDGVYHATVIIEEPKGGEASLDARPSDALALAARREVPIYVSGEVLAEAAKAGKGEKKDEAYWRKYLEGLSSEAFGKYTM